LPWNSPSTGLRYVSTISGQSQTWFVVIRFSHARRAVGEIQNIKMVSTQVDFAPSRVPELLSKASNQQLYPSRRESAIERMRDDIRRKVSTQVDTDRKGGSTTKSAAAREIASPPPAIAQLGLFLAQTICLWEAQRSGHPLSYGLDAISSLRSI